jgi:hypothetical protein
MIMLAPIYINFALACYTSSNPEKILGTDHWNSDAGKDVREWLLVNQLVYPNYESTEKLKAWIEHLCKQPLPEQTWAVPVKRTKSNEE